MPSNPTLPEDVRRAAEDAIYRATNGHTERISVYAVPGLIAPLIIEWARKDQAEKDVQIAKKHRGTFESIEAIRAQFTERPDEPKTPQVEPHAWAWMTDEERAQFTDETTGGTTNG